jgi:RNA polymerase sigma-70 factor (ECF subfamily)
MRRDLVERARRGDHDAFAELAGAAISRLDATAWLMLRDADRAMDAVQTALIRAWRDLPALRDPDRFDAWLYRLVIHACTDEIRQARRHRFDVDISEITTSPAVPDSTSAVADRDQIERGFRRLGPEERAVIVLHHFLDLPLPEVASTLQVPLGTVKSRLYRGLGQMRAVLDADARTGADVREGHSA